MSTLFADSTIAAALWIVIKASALLGIAAMLQLVLSRRASAATRHLVWALAMWSVLLLPAVSLVLPAWAVVVRTVPAPVAPPVSHVHALPGLPSASAPVAVSIEPAPPAPPVGSLTPSTSVIAVYVAGVIVMLIHLLMQHMTVRRVARRATVVQDAEWTRLLSECAGRIGVRRPVRMLRAREQSVPAALGARRPSILIPAIADTWSEDRRRAVMLHELAHVARYDCLTQAVAFAACAIYWFHPAAWWVARRLRIERELACDDRVIAAGTEARDYAGHLLEIAYSLGGRRAPALAVSMARPHQLEGRMLAALDRARNRSIPAARLRLAGVAIAAAVLCPLAGAAPITVEEDRPPVSAPAAARHEAVLAPHLKPVSGLLKDAPRLVRAAATALGIAPEDLPGTWEIRPTGTKGTVHLQLTAGHSSSGSNVPIERLEGLTAAQLTGAGGPITFHLRRDAGTFTFEGVVRQGVGAGTFSFAPDPKFPEELARRGFARPTASEQYEMARHDVGYAFLDELSKQGYAKPETAGLVRAAQHGVDLSYLRDMGALGYRLGSLEPLITLRDHGVDPAYVRELAELGYKGLDADGLRRARDHGISPEYVRAMRESGHGSLPMEALIKARDHGVTAEYIRELADAGHSNLPLDQLIRVRDHGVSPEYIRELRQLGHALPIDELVRSRDHGVSVEFVREMAALGYKGVPMDALIRVRDHGVTPQYAQDLKSLGYDRLALEDLITLRDHGLTPDRIRAANARAGTRLSVEQLKRVAVGGTP